MPKPSGPTVKCPVTTTDVSQVVCSKLCRHARMGKCEFGQYDRRTCYYCKHFTQGAQADTYSCGLYNFVLFDKWNTCDGWTPSSAEEEMLCAKCGNSLGQKPLRRPKLTQTRGAQKKRGMQKPQPRPSST